SLSTHNVLSYAKRIDDICLGEWWQSTLGKPLSSKIQS
ncbi:AraC family transcriptional regulator, partial [Acinetobacter junii]